MRRLMLSLFGLVMITAVSGCIGVAATDNSRGHRNPAEEVIVVNDQVYVINKKTGEAKLVDLVNATAFAKPKAEKEPVTAGSAE